MKTVISAPISQEKRAGSGLQEVRPRICGLTAGCMVLAQNTTNPDNDANDVTLAVTTPAFWTS